jgi:hypothetical protein
MLARIVPADASGCTAIKERVRTMKVGRDLATAGKIPAASAAIQCAFNRLEIVAL